MSTLADRPTRTAFQPLVVDRVDRLTDDAVAVRFAVPPHLAEVFAFAPGQSLTVRRIVDGVEHRRSYSICAAAGAAPRIGVREIPGGVVSAWLVREVRPGDTVEVAPPAGGMRLAAGVGGRHLLVAAGSGITPLLSIAASLLARPDARVSLVYGNRTTSSVMFADELADLKDAHPTRLQLVHVLSREPRDVELLSGRLDAERLRALLDALVPTADLAGAWLCGPLGLVETARGVLAGLGVDADRVHAELFHLDAPPPPLERPERVPEGATAAVTVRLDGRSTTHRQVFESSVLDAAARVRGDLPFACRGGVCGTCRARVVAGEVAMRRNYALDPAEVDRGFVLTCQAHPVSDEVTLDFDG